MISIRFVATIAFAVAMAGCSTSADHDGADLPAFGDPADAPGPIREAASAVVRIASAGSSATGVFISPDGLLLTNNHVLGVDVCPREGCFVEITRAHQRHAKSGPAETIFVEPLHVDVGLDMAVLQAYASENGQRGAKLDGSPYVTFNVRDAASLEGTHVHVIGHPEGHLKKWTSGDVTSSNGQWFESTVFSLPGNSGSPIFDDGGHVVGLLHRGPTSEDVVTRHGMHTYSIGTASAALQAAMNAPLPPSIRSVADPTTADEVVTHAVVFRNARASTANVGGAPTSVLALLGDACDRGLARADVASPDDLTDALAPCAIAAEWIDCRAGAPAGSYAVCPDDAKTAWGARFQKVFDRWRALNGSLQLGYVTSAQAALVASHDEGQSTAAANLERVLSDARPALDFYIAEYMAAFGVDGYDGRSLVDLVRGYGRIPHYDLSITDIAITVLGLNQADKMSGDEALRILRALFDDDGASVGQRLYIEEVLYQSQALD